MTRRPPTIKTSPKASRLINAVLAHADNYAFMGSQHPDDWDGIERGYERAIYNLRSYIAELEKRKPTAASFVEPKPE